MATTAAPTTPQTENPAPKSKKKLIILIVLVLLLAGGGAAAWFLYLKPKQTDAKQEEKPAAPVGPPVFSMLDPFTVNLQPDGQFLQASFTLQLETPEDLQKLKSYLPQVRGRLLLHLTSKNANELATTEGKNQLINEITEQVQTPFYEGHKPVKVLNVFITSFVIQ